jgi:hypothetical protein
MKMKIWKLYRQDAVREEGVREGYTLMVKKGEFIFVNSVKEIRRNMNDKRRRICP